MDALDTITKLINSPPGQLAAGGVLAGIVWKFFERVENVLTDETQLEIAHWLLAREFSPRVRISTSVFARTFDAVFGSNHISLRCLRRSVAASLIVYFIAIVITWSLGHNITIFLNRTVITLVGYKLFAILCAVVFGYGLLFDYGSLLKTRMLIGVAASTTTNWKLCAILLADVAAAACGIQLSLTVWASVFTGVFMEHGNLIKSFAEVVNSFVQQPSGILHPTLSFSVFVADRTERASFDLTPLFVFPAFFTSVWLWLYAGSGFLLRAARDFNIGFQWFNRHFDIEKKPLQSIGLVAGAIVAAAYWTVVIVVRLI